MQSCPVTIAYMVCYGRTRSYVHRWRKRQKVTMHPLNLVNFGPQTGKSKAGVSSDVVANGADVVFTDTVAFRGSCFVVCTLSRSIE